MHFRAIDDIAVPAVRTFKNADNLLLAKENSIASEARKFGGGMDNLEKVVARFPDF